MKRSVLETLLGAIVLVLAAFFVAMAYSTSDIKVQDGYTLQAAFDKVDGIKVGSDVKLSGIKIGSVTAIELDTTRYMALMTINIAKTVKLPTDSAIAIATEGLLGGNYVAITPGGEEEFLAEGEQFQFTQSPVNLTDLLGRFVFSAANNADDAHAPAAPDSDPFN